jgi:hypothetical protein
MGNHNALVLLDKPGIGLAIGTCPEDAAMLYLSVTKATRYIFVPGSQLPRG